MSAKGWIKLHRKITTSDIYNDPDLLRLWIYSLTKASHTDRVIEWDGEKVLLKAGQFITGRKTLTDDYNEELAPKYQVKDTTLWSKFKKIETMEMISIENAPSRKYSIVTILKWSDYQEGDNVHKEDPLELEDENNEEVSEEMSEFLQAGEENSKDLSPQVVDKPKKKKGKREYQKDDIEYKLSSRLFYWMLQNNPKAKAPNPQKWSDTIRLMIERDDRDPEDIALVIDWSQNNDFWMNNILSAEKLRKQFDTLYMQRKADLEKKAKRVGVASSGRGARKNDLLREMMEKEELKNGSQRNDKTILID